MPGSDGLQIIISAGPEDVRRATLGFSLAAAATACGTPLVLFLVMNGVHWACKSMGAECAIPGFQSISTLFEVLEEAGGRIEVCSSCYEGLCNSGQICKDQQDLRAGVVPGGLTGVALRMAHMATVTF